MPLFKILCETLSFSFSMVLALLCLFLHTELFWLLPFYSTVIIRSLRVFSVSLLVLISGSPISMILTPYYRIITPKSISHRTPSSDVARECNVTSSDLHPR